MVRQRFEKGQRVEETAAKPIKEFAPAESEFHPTYLFVLGVLGIAILIDWRNDRVRWPFPFGFIWLAFSFATLFPAWHAQWFDHLCRAIAATA